jgi:hypothetical protein
LLSIGNTWTWASGTGLNNFAAIAVYRSSFAFAPWGVCDGTGPYDLNDPMVYFTGTILSVTGTNSGAAPYTITVAGTPNWTAGQWTPVGANVGAPFSMHDFTLNTGSEIINNGTNNLVLAHTFNAVAWGVGDSIQISRAYQCIDQPGRIGGSLLSGTTPSPTNSSGTYMYQTLDPVYEAADVANAGSGSLNFGFVSSQSARMIANRDYFAEVSQASQTSPTSPFNGTVGTGYGTLANMPSTCTPGSGGAPGVAYWATDQGSWNTSGSGGQGVLYVCTATNTWTVYFTPYIYPHPLDH